MMATKDLEAQINGFCVTTILVNKQTYPRIKMHIFPICVLMLFWVKIGRLFTKA